MAPPSHVRRGVRRRYTSWLLHTGSSSIHTDPSRCMMTPSFARTIAPYRTCSTRHPCLAAHLSVSDNRRIAFVIAFRHSIDPTRGGRSTARRILSHGHMGFPRDDTECREVYRIIARIAHPNKNLARDAYHCTIADIAMDTAQRASDIVASPSTSDRGAFLPLPALESAQFSAIVDTHRRAKLGRPAPMRSPATPPTANGGAAPVLTKRLLPVMPRIPSLSLLDPAEPTPPSSGGS